ncbi:hypothetical protein [Coprobacter fastidiosus]|nr:hypothetical protein [Coprobacter fastidiosus]BEG61965.1 hypothetical protein Cfast33896_09200 [Coprobacter fastidiosus]
MMKICNINYMGVVALFLFSILFVSCKDENKNDAPKIQLDVSEIIVEEGEAVVVTVSGVESFTASIAPENIASAGVSGNVIRVKGIQAGKGTLTVTSGEYTVSCPVTVSGDFYKDTDVRIEGWKNDIVYPEKEEGYSFSREKGFDALGLAKSRSIVWDYAPLGDDATFFRISVSGDFVEEGEILEDGLVVIREAGQPDRSLIAERTVLNKISGKRYWITFEFGGSRQDIRLVADGF